MLPFALMSAAYTPDSDKLILMLGFESGTLHPALNSKIEKASKANLLSVKCLMNILSVKMNYFVQEYIL